MHKVRIISRGWEGLNGSFAGVEFKDGVSVREITGVELQRVTGGLRVVDLEGHPVGPAAELIEGTLRRAPVVAPLKTQTEDEKAAEVAPAEKKAIPAIYVFHTTEELEKIADEKGINGLRALAEPLGVKGRSITDLIREIAEAEAKIKAAATLTPAA